MSRPFWTRALAPLVGLWFVVVAAGPWVTHACPRDGAHVTAAHSVAAHVQHGTSRDETHHHGGTQCTCLGQCCSAAPIAFAPAPLRLPDVVTVSTRDAGLPDHAYVPVAAEHVLPPALAPPLSA